MFPAMTAAAAMTAPVLASSAFLPIIHSSSSDDIEVSRPMRLLVTMVPDDSSSINSYGNAPAIRRGHNAQLDMYEDHPGNILVRTRYLNGLHLFDYSRPADAVRMDERNYNPQLGTPLYDETYKVLQEVQRSLALYADAHDVYTITCIMTDGAENQSKRRQARDVKAVVDRMFDSGRHIVAGIGVRDGHTDFFRVFSEMGIPEQWIKVLEREEGDIVTGMTDFSHTSMGIRDARSFRRTTTMGFDQSSPPTPPNGHDT